MTQNNYVEITVPKKIEVFEDKKTRAKTIAFPFRFLDGEKGFVTITKAITDKWKPNDEIQTITITFNDYPN